MARAGTGRLDPLPERERKGLRTRVQEFNLELSFGDRACLAYQLVQPPAGECADAVAIHVGAVGGTRRGAIDAHAIPDSAVSHRLTHDEMQIARLETADDTAAGAVQHNRFPLDRPVTRERPLVEPQPRRRGVGAAL